MRGSRRWRGWAISTRVPPGRLVRQVAEPALIFADFDHALTTAPDSPNTLFNRGLVRWKGKKDGRGALEDLRKLLAQDPNYEAKEQAKQIIAEIEGQTALGGSH